MSTTEQRGARELVGEVVSNRMDKTVVVRIDRHVTHPLYGKVIHRSSRISAHDADNACNMGDVVTITSCRPISRTKSWRVTEISTSAAGSGKSKPAAAVQQADEVSAGADSSSAVQPAKLSAADTEVEAVTDAEIKVEADKPADAKAKVDTDATADAAGTEEAEEN